jgi:dodecin
MPFASCARNLQAKPGRPRGTRRFPRHGGRMTGHTYSVTEIVGTSEKDVNDAIRNGIATAAKTLRNLDWFEVTEVRGRIADGKVSYYQVGLKLGLRYEER